MKHLILALLLLPFLFGCGKLLDAGERGAVKMADIKEAYCRETDANAREQFRELYNAEMDKRGLPHDQINCPEASLDRTSPASAPVYKMPNLIPAIHRFEVPSSAVFIVVNRDEYTREHCGQPTSKQKDPPDGVQA